MQWTWLVVVAGVGCAESHGPASGFRADGLFVECTADGEDRWACEPDEAGGEGEGEGEADGGDACADWSAGGPAIVLWPPNHSLHEVTVADCAALRPACEAARAPGLAIVAVTSDEPLEVGAGGDGHTDTDDLAVVDATTVRLRSERQGAADGRVYRIEMTADGGETSVCEVHVPHDRGPYGGAVAGSVAVRVTR